MGKYFTEHERYQLEILLKEKTPVKEISHLLNKCTATIYNEIKRGMITLRNHDWTEYTIYQADVAQRKYDEHKINKGRPNKLENDTVFIESVQQKIGKEKYSPSAFFAYLAKNNLSFNTQICIKTLYNYIEKGLISGLSKDTLPMPRKARKKRKFKPTVALKSLSLRSIEERPEDVMERDVYGHWEMDTVVSGMNKSATLLVLTERMTRQEIIRKMPDRTVQSVVSQLNLLESEIGFKTFRNTFKTITMDNGVEFKDMNGIETSCLDSSKKRTVSYFCHPYCSWERGSNENANKLIRRWIKKVLTYLNIVPNLFSMCRTG